MTEPTYDLRFPGAAPPGFPGRATATRPSRPSRPPAAPSGLEQVLLGLSWASPSSHELAKDAITRLERTHAQLAAFTAPGPGRTGTARAIGALHARIGFVLHYWTGALAALEPEHWNEEHAAGLDRDLREIASTGALALNLVTSPATTPGPDRPRPADPTIDTGIGLEPGGARHRSSGRREAGSARPSAGNRVAARPKLPQDGARLIAQTAGFVLAVAVVSGVCFEAFDRHPGSPSPAQPAAIAHGTGSADPTHSQPPTPTTSSMASRAAASGTVDSLQIQLLGASTAQPRIEVIVYLDTASTAPVTVAISYRSENTPQPITTTRTASGETSYQIALPIDVAAYCNQAVLVAASADGLSASQSTSAGACVTSSTSPTVNGSNT